MFRSAILIITTLMFAASFVMGEISPPDKSQYLDTGGDSPLTTSYVWQGHGGIEVAPLAIDGLPNPSGTIVEDSIPAHSTIVYAYFGTMGWHSGVQSASAVFNGTQLASIPPAVNDPTGSYELSFYKWDVTSQVTGNGSYSFTLTNHTYCYVAFLVIIYENAAAPPVRIFINDGSEALMNASSVTLFSGMQTGGGVVKILTEAGNTGSTGESIEFNGQVLAGPGDIFACNIGDHADYFAFDLTSLTGEDSLTLTTGSDQIGIHFAALIGVAEDLHLTLTPHNPPIRIPAGGGTIVFDALIENTADSAITFDAWTEVVLPNTMVYGPLILRSNLVIPALSTIMRQISQTVPGIAPPGNYVYVGNAGSHPGNVMATDSFPFTKLAGDAPLTHNEGWAVCGWFGDEADLFVSDYALNGAFPNPFNPTTTISFTLPQAGKTHLSVFDITGREVAVLANGWYNSGVHKVAFNGSGLASGIYFYKLTADDFSATRKMVLVR